MENNFYYFCSAIYIGKHPEFLDAITKSTNIALENISQKINEIYPMQHSVDFANDPTVEDFCIFVGNKGWEFLSHQGYDMSAFGVSIDSVWTQVHYKHSLMEQHTHPGAQLVGFYFIETPEGSSKPLFHDPRPAKVQTGFVEQFPEKATLASNIINFTPEPGMLIISNAWLPHSFSRHASEEPAKFVHFNLGVMLRPPEYQENKCALESAEVI